MDTIGAEVGQKMRSAIKAKLMELNCYVDDELPDYIMVMVANKRSKSQMNEDLQLFLNTKTSTFVDWLHIVLKKLKEVTVTNPEVYKQAAKRKEDEIPECDIKIKKEKKDKKSKKAKKKETAEPENSTSEFKSLTDDLPISANKLSGKHKILLTQESISNNGVSRNVDEDSFDIPPLSEVNLSSESELIEIEKKIKSVKSRLGILVESDSEDIDFINLKADPDDLFPNEHSNKSDDATVTRKEPPIRRIQIVHSADAEEQQQNEPNETQQPTKRNEHTRITFSPENNNSPNRKKSVLERLGKRISIDSNSTTPPKKTRINLSEARKEEERILGNTSKRSNKRPNIENDQQEKKRSRKPRESALSRLGVMSKVLVPPKEDPPPEEEPVQREVQSVVKIKPRVIPPATKQANKNLLLKAVAEAQRSIAQTPSVGNTLKPDALFTKKYKEKRAEEKQNTAKLPDKEKQKIRNIIVQLAAKETTAVSSEDDDNLEYIPKPLKKKRQNPDCEYVPSSKLSTNIATDDFANTETAIQQKFIITLDGIDKTKFKSAENPVRQETKNAAKRTPSPIIFDKVTAPVKNRLSIPDKLPIVHPSPAMKNKERCKYWPACRQGEKCEFIHPTTSCKMFPQCKFGDECLYIHPSCKFENSCTRRDCPYSHGPQQKAVASRVVPSSAPISLTPQTLQTCKFFPNCTNLHCTFYHPRPCKFGKFCKNQSECNFSHAFTPAKNKLTWRPNLQS